MYVYKLNEDGGVELRATKPEYTVPDGWTPVPPALENKNLYWVDGALTDQKPQTLIDDQRIMQEAEEKIEAKIRENAIADLIAAGTLPPDFKDKKEK